MKKIYNIQIPGYDWNSKQELTSTLANGLCADDRSLNILRGRFFLAWKKFFWNIDFTPCRGLTTLLQITLLSKFDEQVLNSLDVLKISFIGREIFAKSLETSKFWIIKVAQFQLWYTDSVGIKIRWSSHRPFASVSGQLNYINEYQTKIKALMWQEISGCLISKSLLNLFMITRKLKEVIRLK